MVATLYLTVAEGNRFPPLAQRRNAARISMVNSWGQVSGSLASFVGLPDGGTKTAKRGVSSRQL
jgi:hypothetical protein